MVTVPEAFEKLGASRGWGWAPRFASPRSPGLGPSWQCLSPPPRNYVCRDTGRAPPERHPTAGPRVEAGDRSGPGRFPRRSREWEGFLASVSQIWGGGSAELAKTLSGM